MLSLLSLLSCRLRATVIMLACQVWYTALTLNNKHRQNIVGGDPTRQSCVHINGVWAVQLLLHGSEQQGGKRVITTGATGLSHYSLLTTELGLWPGVDSFLTTSVCMGSMCDLEREWYTGCAALSPTIFRLADDSHKNGSSIRALLYML